MIILHALWLFASMFVCEHMLFALAHTHFLQEPHPEMVFTLRTRSVSHSRPLSKTACCIIADTDVYLCQYYVFSVLAVAPKVKPVRVCSNDTYRRIVHQRTPFSTCLECRTCGIGYTFSKRETCSFFCHKLTAFYTPGPIGASIVAMSPSYMLDRNPALLMSKPTFESRGPPIVSKECKGDTGQKSIL